MEDTPAYLTGNDITGQDIEHEISRYAADPHTPTEGWTRPDGTPCTLGQLGEAWRVSQNREYPEDRKTFADWLEGEILAFRIIEPGMRMVHAEYVVTSRHAVEFTAPAGLSGLALRNWFEGHRDDVFTVRSTVDFGKDVELVERH